MTEAVFVPHSERLLGNARTLFDQGKYGLAVIVAHTACEVGVERAFSQALRHRGISDLEDALGTLVSSFNITNGRVHRLFTALTGETVTDKPWWRGLDDSCKLRNRIVHKGTDVDKGNAEATLDVTKDVVEFFLHRFG